MFSEYLIFNFIIGVFPSLGMYFYKRGFWPRVRSTIVSIFAISMPYMIWDQIVTGSWWSFNEKYITGLKVGKLPIEELLFFFIVPWSCLVIWENIKRKINGEWNMNIEGLVIFSSFLVGLGAFLEAKWYLLVVCAVVVSMCILSLYTHTWFRRKASSVYLLIVFILTLIFNGYLTFRPVVIYNPAKLVGMYVFSIPVEDIFYGLALISGIVILYEKSYNS